MKKIINVAIVGKGSMGRTHSSSIAMLKYSFKNLPVKDYPLIITFDEIKELKNA